MTFSWIGKSEDGSRITLHKLNDSMFKFSNHFTPDWVVENPDLVRVGAAIDVETTGLDKSKDKVIEVGLRKFKFNRLTGELISLDSSYSGFQDPGEPLSEEIKKLTGINDDMLKGQVIDWKEVDALLSTCHVIIAHNASFDRPFVDAHAIESKNKIWGCSLNQIDWIAHGFNSKKLDILSIYHGFFTDAHRALNDSDALIYLLSLNNTKTQAPYLIELLNNARKSTILISAWNAAYEKKDFLRFRGYKWDGKVWSKEVYKELHDAEINWLEEVIYQGSFRGKVHEILPVNHFKSVT